MKTQQILTILFVTAILFIVGCGHDYKVKTIVNADGSCQRILTVTGDSISDFFAKNYPVPIDTSWNLVTEKDTNKNGETIFVYKASKYFENIEQLNQLYCNDTSKYKIIERTVTFKKRFRWFYTFLDYNETYPQLFNQPSLQNYMDSAQYSYAMLSDDEKEEYLTENFDSLSAKQFDDEVEKRFFKWIENTILLSCFDAIEKSAPNIEDWTLSESEFITKKDSIAYLLDDTTDLFDNDDDVFEAAKRVFGIDSLLYTKLEKQEPFKEFIDKYEFWEDVFTSEDYTNTVSMPGLIIETSSNMVRF